MKKRFSHNATIQQKLVLTLLLSILTPMIIFGSIFRIYSRREFNAQTLSSIRTGFQSSINSFQDQLQLITYAERSFYSNEKVQTALSGDGHYDSIAEQQAVEDYIFYLLRSINSMVTDASIIHLSAYHLSTDYYLTKNFDQYSFPLIAPEVRENVQAYSSYLEPGQYTPTHTLSVNDDIGFTICLPLYSPPSIDNSIGFLEVIIPRSRLESLCSSLYDATDSEGLLVLTENDHVLYEVNCDNTARYTHLLSTMNGENQINTISYENGITVLYEHLTFKNVNLKIARIIPMRALGERSDDYITGLMVLLVALVAMAAFLMCLCTIQFTRPIQKLMAYTCAVRDGDLNARMEDFITYDAPDEIGTLIHDVQEMVQTIHRYIIRQYQLVAENKDIQLKMLQAQINPHFLFNTLQCLAGQALELDSMVLYTAIAALGQMMHYSMDTEHVMVSLKDEKEYASSYLMLQRMRFPVQLDEQWDVSDEALAFPVPKMILQPLVENAVRHGEILKSDGHTLHVFAAVASDGLMLRITDDGIGCSTDDINMLRQRFNNLYEGLRSASMRRDTALNLSRSTLQKDSLSSVQQNVQSMQTHIGLQNVYQRLLLRCGWGCTIQVQNLQPHGFEVELFIEKGAQDENPVG